MNADVLQKQKATLEARGLDALVAASPDNVAYTLGFPIPSQTLGVRTRVFLSVVGRDQFYKMIAASPEVVFIQGQPGAPEVRAYDEFKGNPMADLAETLMECGRELGRVGIELDFLPAKHFAELVRLMPHTSFVEAGPLFDRMRMVKTPHEIDILRKVGRAAHDAWYKACTSARVGITERQLCRLIVEALFDEGVDEVRMIQVGSGKRSSYANPFPTDRRMERGDLVKIDIMAAISGYLSDTGRAAVVGKAAPEYERIWAGMVQTQREVLKHIRPGVRTQTLWDVFEESFGRVGLKPSIRLLGHSLGLSVHEEPFIGKDRDEALSAGMVMAVEPIYKVPGELGFHLEDELVVTPDGYDLFTDTHDVSELMVIR